MNRFSRPVRSSSTAACCPAGPIAARTRPGSLSTSCPATRAEPASGRSSVASIRTVVVLPAPLGPSSATTVPIGTFRSRSATAVKWPKRLVRPDASIAVVSFMGWNSTVTEKFLQLNPLKYAVPMTTVDEDALEEPFNDDRVHRVLTGELGEGLADALRRVRRFQEAMAVRRHPEEGLRERKRRLTRQRISDVATILFASRGFDNVKVSTVADIVGVSEKTIYNYFPTKESMVLDWADEAIGSLAQVIRECPANESLTTAVVRAMKADMERFDEVPDDLVVFLPRFIHLIESTPALRAAWLEMNDRVVTVAAEALAARAEVDPRDPEPMIAARTLSGLGGVALAARVRYIEQGLRGIELRDAVLTDLERA